MTVALIAFGVLLLVGVPIVFVLGLSSVLGLVLTTQVPIAIVSQRVFYGLDSFTIMAIPFFIFLGNIMDAGGISRRIVDLATALIGWLTGSLYAISVATATGLAAISGSGTADVAAVSSIMQPQFRRHKYDTDFGAALIACAGSLAQVIPPSILLVIIAILANISIGALFLAGIIPGLLTSGALLLTGYIVARRGGPQYREGTKFTWTCLVQTGIAAAPAMLMPIIVMGGILGGITTPTEAAALACAYGLLVGAFVYRELDWRKLFEMTLNTVSISAAVMIIIGVAGVFGWMIANENIPGKLGAWLSSIVDDRLMFLLVVNVVLLVVGMFMEAIAAVTILFPILMPIAIAYGIDPIHFAIVVGMNLSIGLVTPPYGISAFVAATVAHRTVLQVTRKLFVPWLAMLSILLLVTFVPDVALVLPRAFGFID